MSTLNVVPSYHAAGSFTANNPFNLVVKPEIYYTIEAIRSITEMQGMNLDLWSLIFQPAGILQTDYQSYIDNINSVTGAAIVVLIGKDGSRVYVPTTYLASFPLVDGVSYERICIIGDCGACPPALADELTDTLTHFQNYLAAHVGINATFKLGTIPTIGYVTAAQAAVNEATRKNAITNTSNDVTTIAEQTTTISGLQAYVAQLEAKVISLSQTPVTPTDPPVTP